jgi:peptidyl-prolyl cis-trans isomerase SurA
MLYDFEDAAYSTPKGDVSAIFKTRYGYHFLQNNGTRTSKGERQVAHILISDTTSTGKNKINEVYAKLKEGIYFNKLSQQYSNDGNTKNKGGVLPRFGSGRMVKPFENAAFSLDTIGEYSKPFKTKYGWHIVKLLKQYPILPFNEMEKVISDKVRNSGRAKLSDNAVLNRLKKEYSITVTDSSKKLLQRKDLRNLSTDSLKNTLLTINDKILLQSDFVSYVKNQRLASFDDMMEKFINAEILTYFKENLVNTDSNFAYTLSEYEDGLLLFELMQQKIWNKSSDTIALKNYFKSRKSLYNSDDLKSIKGKVMNDFQLYLDQEWIGQLRSENDVKINRKVLKKIKSYYRKES